MADMKTIGQRLRDARGERTLQEVAPQIGISYQMLSYLEHGTRHPSLETMTKLAAFYGKTLDQLFT